MSKFIQITHTYVIEFPDEAEDAVINTGVSMMEGWIEGKSPRARDIKSSWLTMPKEYSRSVPAHIEETRVGHMILDPDGPGQLHPVIMGGGGSIMHPWDQGLFIFPDSHPYHDIEKHYRSQYHDPQYKDHLKPELKKTVARLQLEAPKTDDDE